MKRRVVPFAALALGHCATLASEDTADRELPVSRTGPFRELTLAEGGNRACVGVDFNGGIDEPDAVRAPDGSLALYVSRTREGGGTSIARVALRSTAYSVGDPVDVLMPSLPWQGGAISSPSVAVTAGGYVMTYATRSGALGLARSRDGMTWQPDPTPALEADTSAGEGGALGAPSVVALATGELVMAYASRGAIWLARTDASGRGFTRVDGDPTTPVREAVLAAAPASRDGGAPSFESGEVGDPELEREVTTTGRAIWRLYYSARSAEGAMDGGVMPEVVIGMAGSFDGVHFERLGAPVLRATGDRGVAAPSVLADGPRRTMMYVGSRCDLSRLRRGVRANVAPVTERLPTIE